MSVLRLMPMPLMRIQLVAMKTHLQRLSATMTLETKQARTSRGTTGRRTCAPSSCW